jgi:hypothetical protein
MGGMELAKRTQSVSGHLYCKTFYQYKLGDGMNRGQLGSKYVLISF